MVVHFKLLAALIGTLGLLAGCANTSESVAPATSASTKATDEAAEKAARAAAERSALERAAAEKAAAEKLAAEKAAADKAAVDAAARAKAAASKPLTIKGLGLFDFNKSVLRPDAKSALEKEVVAKKEEIKSISTVSINGHADRLGSNEYNQKLSEKRAEVVKAYLVGQGVPANNVDTFGFGKTQPAQGVAKCEDSLSRSKLIECLQPHRRVEVELKGEAK